LYNERPQTEYPGAQTFVVNPEIAAENPAAWERSASQRCEAMVDAPRSYAQKLQSKPA